MTKDVIIKGLNCIKARAEVSGDAEFWETANEAIKLLEQTDKVEESNFNTEQYKADLQADYEAKFRETYDCGYDCGYSCGYADAMNDIAESEE